VLLGITTNITKQLRSELQLLVVDVVMYIVDETVSVDIKDCRYIRASTLLFLMLNGASTVTNCIRSLALARGRWFVNPADGDVWGGGERSSGERL
jgi:hypothetical protein